MVSDAKKIKIGVVDFTVMPYEIPNGRGFTRTKEVWLSGKADENGNIKYCRICISPDICEQAGFKAGDRVEFACSKDHTQMALVKHKVGCFMLKKSGNGCAINSVQLALDIRAASRWGHSDATSRFKAKVIDGCVVFERYEDDD